MTGSWTLKRVATKNRQRLGYRRIVQLIVYLVIIPTVLLLSTGIVLMFLGELINLVLGILVISFVAVVVTGVVLVIVFVRREANLSELQADFVSKVSHELKTPLTAIRLLAETIERAGGDETTREKCLAMLVEETERLTGRIDRLLDWGRMEAGRKIYDLRKESPADIVSDAIDAFAPFRVHRAVDFAAEVAPDAPTVLADRNAVCDAVLNLLSNALKYGGTPPVVRLVASRTPNGNLSIAVSDNGGGIAHAEQRRIFEKFYRIDDRLSREREGSGLGLAIVKHVVRAHHGKITLESAPGKGSTFRIVLPRYAPPRRSTAAEEIAVKGAS